LDFWFENIPSGNPGAKGTLTQGCQIFLSPRYQNVKKYTYITTTKYTQIGVFGMKIYHLATLLSLLIKNKSRHWLCG
jgi:hypothetical protein